MNEPEKQATNQALLEPEIDFRQILQILLRRRWVAVCTLGVVLLGGVLVTIRAPRVYKARATVLIEQSAPDVLANVREVYDLGATGFWASKEYYETQYKIISSLPVAEKAAARLGLAPKALAEQVRALGPEPLEARAAGDALSGMPASLRSKLDLLGVSGVREREELAELLETLNAGEMIQALTRVEPVKDSRLVGVSVEGSNPERAATIANAMVDAYIEYNLDQKVSATRSAVDWLSDQMHELKDKLQQSELLLYEFKRDNNVVSVSIEDRQTMISETLSQLNRSAAESRAKLLALESRRDQIKRARQDGTIDSISEVINHDVVQQLKADLTKLREEESDLKLRYTEDHPKFTALREKLALVRAELKAEVDRIVQSIDKQYEAALDADRRLVLEIDRVKNDALDLNKKEIEYNRLKRERDNNQALYDLVLKRQKEADLTQMLKVNNVRKLEAAQAPLFPVRPRVQLNLLLSLVLGIFAGVGLAFLVDFLDNSLKSQAQVEQRLGLSFLGIVPSIKSDKGVRIDLGLGERDRYVIEHPRSSVAECCRTVRANLLFMSHEREAKRLLVTSSGPQEGKTTTAVNLAVTMAQSGMRTLIIDTDMRRPRLHKSFSVANEAGISNLILGAARIDDVVRASGVDGLDLVTCGPIPPNPAELLHAESFQSIMAELSKRYDRIFFDSPPVGAVADALVLSAAVDGTVLVVLAGKTSWQAALQAKRRLEDVGGRLLGVVLNGVDLEDKRAGDYYHYYAYYHSGYGEDPKAKGAA